MKKTISKLGKVLFWAIPILIVCQTVFQLSIYIFYTSLGVGGAGDWTYDKLPGSYEIWRFNADNISLIKVNGIDRTSGQKIIVSNVKAFYCDERFIAIKSSDEKAADQNQDDISMYYIVDSVTQDIFGPFVFSEFCAQCKSHEFAQGEWIQTEPKPSGAYS